MEERESDSLTGGGPGFIPALKRQGKPIEWNTAVAPALWRLRRKDQEFESSLDYRIRPCLKKEEGKGRDICYNMCGMFHPHFTE